MAYIAIPNHPMSAYISAGMFPQVAHHTPESAHEHLQLLVTKPVATTPENDANLAAFGFQPPRRSGWSSGYFDLADLPARLVVPKQVPPPVPFVAPPPPPRDPWEGHDGKDAAGFMLAYAFGTELPDGWREPTWHDVLTGDVRMVPGYKRELRSDCKLYGFAGLNFVMAAANVPAMITGHLFNDLAAVVAVVAGTALVANARRLAHRNAAHLL